MARVLVAVHRSAFTSLFIYLFIYFSFHLNSVKQTNASTMGFVIQHLIMLIPFPCVSLCNFKLAYEHHT